MVAIAGSAAKHLGDRFTPRRALGQASPTPTSKARHLCTASSTAPPLPTMSLVSGPGRGGVTDMPAELRLFVDKHVRYIQSLDTVRLPLRIQ